ncbi:MAG: DNA-protecting protein DprA [Candidatus Levybacteria bacterium]|nr:DNA-protecting protein DprA [Candidatus Levybacteria bacterium]MBI3070023.1 DNA-protecting protein DprA [Candidatus Levybacteria bacterium]
MAERFFWLAFSAFPGIGPMKFQKLLGYFGSAKSAWEAKATDLTEILGKSLTAKLENFRRNFSVEKYAAELKKKNASFFIFSDKEYPKLLAQIKNPPFVLYVRGNINVLAGVSRAEVGNKNFLVPHSHTARHANNKNFFPSPRVIAVVGTRRITSYGREVTEMFVRELADAGFTIVSGLAIGVDAVAHQTSIEAASNGRKTIAVLGCGVDCCTPRENQHLYNSIVGGGGAVISELPLGHPPTKGSFPSRNRIIAGLSLGVLVTEGAEDSGALITADYALKFNRRVFAVPGPITSSLSKGPYKLIQKGAKLVTNAQDVINELGITGTISTTSITGKRSVRGENKEEQKVLTLLEHEALHFDEIARITGFEPSKLGSILSIMEMKGMVKSLDIGLFSITS